METLRNFVLAVSFIFPTDTSSSAISVDKERTDSFQSILLCFDTSRIAREQTQQTSRLANILVRDTIFYFCYHKGMNDVADLLVRMRSAYEIFAEELEKHLGFLLETSNALGELEKEDELEKFFSDKAKSLEQRFHVLKGGAGFLKLNKVADISDKFESVFKRACVNHDDLALLKSEFVQSISQLKVELAELNTLLANTASDDSP